MGGFSGGASQSRAVFLIIQEPFDFQLAVKVPLRFPSVSDQLTAYHCPTYNYINLHAPPPPSSSTLPRPQVDQNHPSELSLSLSLSHPSSPVLQTNPSTWLLFSPVTLSPRVSSSRKFIVFLFRNFLSSIRCRMVLTPCLLVATSPGLRRLATSPLAVSPSTTRPLRSGRTRRLSSSPFPVCQFLLASSPPVCPTRSSDLLLVQVPSLLSALPDTSPATSRLSPSSVRRVSTLLPSLPTTTPTS